MKFDGASAVQLILWSLVVPAVTAPTAERTGHKYTTAVAVCRAICDIGAGPCRRDVESNTGVKKPGASVMCEALNPEGGCADGLILCTKNSTYAGVPDVRLLVLVLSCASHADLWPAKLEAFPDTVIAVGDPELKTDYELKDGILRLRCSDQYDALPEKVVYAIHAILRLPDFRTVTHLLKTDDHDNSYTATDIERVAGYSELREHHYMGVMIHGEKECEEIMTTDAYNVRQYHFGKVSETSRWHNRPYTGEYVPWADGGQGYVVDRVAMRCINRQRNLRTISQVRDEEVFEDVMVAKLLRNFGILPAKALKLIEGDEK